MVTTLSELVEMMEQSIIPAWVRDQILAKSELIDQALRNGGSITLEGPDGETVEISGASPVAAAA